MGSQITGQAWFFASALLVGAAVRLAAVPLPGSTDVPIFRVWSHYAVVEGVARLYGTGGRYPERRLLEYDGVPTKVDYPPLALYELAIASPKALAFAGDTAAALLLFVVVRRRTSAIGTARRATLSVWLNPAIILLGAVLGYLDVLYVVPALAALVLAAGGSPFATGVLIAAACLTKPLAVLALPAVVLALWNAPGVASPVVRLAESIAAAIVTVAVTVSSVAFAGGFFNMLWGIGSVLRDPFLSGAAANLWWLLAPLTVTQVPLDLLRGTGAMMAAAAIAWAIARARSTGDVFLLAALAAFTVHAYAVLAVSVHENHLAGAIPFLALASATRPRLMPILIAVSAIAALNMNVFYGLGVGIGWAVPRSIAGFDVMSVLSLANCLALAWHGAILRTETQ